MKNRRLLMTGIVAGILLTLAPAFSLLGTMWGMGAPFFSWVTPE
jgi:hypothetical protein